MNAHEKCGYFPATRNALKHDLIQHEIFIGDAECIDVDADPHGEMLAMIEKANHSSKTTISLYSIKLYASKKVLYFMFVINNVFI